MAYRRLEWVMIWLLFCLPTSVGMGQTRSEDPVDQAAAEPQLTVDEAIQDAIEAVERLEATEDPEARQALTDDIQRYMEQVQALNPGSPWYHYVYGRTYVALGRLSTARDELLKFVETREGQNEWQAHRLLGDLFVDAWPSLAKPYYEKAAALKPNEPAVLRGLSACMYRLADYDQAIQYARELVAADGRENSDYVLHLGRMLAAKQLWAEAEREAARALDLAKVAAARKRPGTLAAVTALQGPYELLIEIAQARVNEEPEAPERYVNLARIMHEWADLARLRAHHERLRILELGLGKVGPAVSPGLLEAYAVALAEVGREREAIETLSRVLTINPDSTTAREWLVRLSPTTESDQPTKP